MKNNWWYAYCPDCEEDTEHMDSLGGKCYKCKIKGEKDMRKLYWKEDLPATCPYCGDTSGHVFYLNATSLLCNNPKCEKEFQIELFVENVEVRVRC